MKTGAGFKCQKCGAPTHVIDSRAITGNGAPHGMLNGIDYRMAIRRRRECKRKKCKYRFSTIEYSYDDAKQDIRQIQAVKEFGALIRAMK